MAPNKTATPHVPYPVFFTDTAPEPFEESGVNSPPASPTAFIRTKNMLGLIGVPAANKPGNVVGFPSANEVAKASPRSIEPMNGAYSDPDSELEDDGNEEDQILEIIGLAPIAQGPPAIVQHGTFVVPLPEVVLEFPPPPPHNLLLNTNGFEFAPIAVPEMVQQEAEPQAQDGMAGEPVVNPNVIATGLPSPASTATSDEGLEQVSERVNEDDARSDGGADPVFGSELEDDLFDFEDVPSVLTHPTPTAPPTKRPSAPVLVQPRGDGRAEVRLLLDDDDGFLDDIEEYMNGEFEMYSFGALAEMMGERVDLTGEWVARTGAAVAALTPREARRMLEMRPVRPLDAFAGLAAGEEAYRPPTPLGMSESDEEDLNRPLSPTGDGDSEVTAVEGSPSVPASSASSDEERAAFELDSTKSTEEDKGKGKASKTTSTSNLRATLAGAAARPSSPPVRLPALGEAGPSSLPRRTRHQPEVTPVRPAPTSPTPAPRAATLKRKASDADLDGAKDAKGKAAEAVAVAVKRQRLLLRRSSQSSLGSM